jgi:hypothetical protein
MGGTRQYVPCDEERTATITDCAAVRLRQPKDAATGPASCSRRKTCLFTGSSPPHAAAEIERKGPADCPYSRPSRGRRFSRAARLNLALCLKKRPALAVAPRHGTRALQTRFGDEFRSLKDTAKDTGLQARVQNMPICRQKEAGAPGFEPGIAGPRPVNSTSTAC